MPCWTLSGCTWRALESVWCSPQVPNFPELVRPEDADPLTTPPPLCSFSLHLSAQQKFPVLCRKPRPQAQGLCCRWSAVSEGASGLRGWAT